MGQTLEYYKTAYNYLNDSLAIDSEQLSKYCQTLDSLSRFPPSLVVTPKLRKIEKGFPYCEYLRKHDSNINCAKLFGEGIPNERLDSINHFFSEYKHAQSEEYLNFINANFPVGYLGYTVTFSPIYKNTLTAELFIKCYTADIKMGGAFVYFFVFTNMGQISNIYYEESIHYN